ncbi:hypothetical protein DY000_02035002 [Brassica cretica]|uniref:DUF1618 domain-containing protein n=1 Tax=Brassica cretica TaxID=69181 RepID=A0ABQ7DMW1_BRACR|nr:hypothetical protein DY000_02035002 [Brassica cretica]
MWSLRSFLPQALSQRYRPHAAHVLSTNCSSEHRRDLSCVGVTSIAPPAQQSMGWPQNKTCNGARGKPLCPNILKFSFPDFLTIVLLLRRRRVPLGGCRSPSVFSPSVYLCLYVFSQFAAEVVFPEAFRFRSGDFGLDLVFRGGFSSGRRCVRHRVAPPRAVSLSVWRVAGFGVVLVVDLGFEICGSLGSPSCFSDLWWSPKVACWVRVRIGVFVDLSCGGSMAARGSGCHLCYVSELACGWVGGRNLQLLSLNDGIVIWDLSRAAGSRVFQGLRAPLSPVARGD